MCEDSRVWRVAIVVALLAVGMTAAFSLSAAKAAEAAQHRNVLLIITDQQHAGMMSCAGNSYLKTPAMDSLAASGVRFERAYCANPVCIPSRFSMMTGVLPSRIGMDRNSNGLKTVPPEVLEHALGTVFRNAGYETVYGGKVHLPGAKQGVQTYGFDLLVKDEREELANASAAFLRAPHDRPFLLVASFINPHDICYMAIDAYTAASGKPAMFPGSSRERACLAESLRLPPGVTKEDFFARLCPPLPANYDVTRDEPAAVRGSDWRSFRAYAQEHWGEEQWRMHRWAYARLTERVDAEIATVLAALRASGRDKDTLVVFTSDHGDMDSAHRLEHKSMPFEEATRVPLIVSCTGVARAGHVDKMHLVSTGLDLIPTLCDMAGIAVPAALKGRSVKPLVVDPAEPVAWRESLVVENERSRILLSDRYKYAVYDQGPSRELLLDLKEDPGEMRNLAGDAGHRDTLRRHRALLAQWYREYGQPLEEAFVVGETGE